MALAVNWIKCEGEGRQGKHWCKLLKLKLEAAHFDDLEGVYVIWHGGPDPTCLRIGRGVIRERLDAHRNEQEVLAYRQQGLYATWARVPAHQRDGVERYLVETLMPNAATRRPKVNPIEVDLPR